jgi:uncharacterized protein (TIGR02186 family)
MIRWLALAFGWIMLAGAAEPVLVPDVSDRNIEIRYSFHGTEILLFGAILYPGGLVPQGKVDVAVVVRGPSKSIKVREKQKLAGLIWVNADDTRFRSAPAFYAIASSRPLAKIVDERTADIYELGLSSLQLSPSSGMRPEDERRFETGLIDLRKRSALYAAHPGTVEITNDVLYRARLEIPARVPVGHYTAETFLIRNGHVIAAATRDVEIRKTGFERFVAVSALAFPFAYGVVAIALSVFLGWGAGALFRRI